MLTTPKGVAVYPHLTKPDTKFNAEGVYTIKLKLEGADAEKLAKEIDAGIDASGVEAKADKKNAGKKIKRADPPYSRKDDGSIEFSFKMNATGKTKEGEVFTRKPIIFDKSAKPVQGLRIGGGSIVKVGYEMVPFFTALVGAGVTLRLHAVQVLELVEYGANAAYYGFGNEAPEGETEAAAVAETVPAAEAQTEPEDGSAF